MRNPFDPTVVRESADAKEGVVKEDTVKAVAAVKEKIKARKQSQKIEEALKKFYGAGVVFGDIHVQWTFARSDGDIR
jgi:hypothetical protein